MIHPNCTVLLYRRHCCADGKSVFGYPETHPGCLILRQQCSAAASGLREEEQSLLYLEGAVDPAPGDEIQIGTRRFTIGSVRQCRDLQGGIRACRCTFLQHSV